MGLILILSKVRPWKNWFSHSRTRRYSRWMTEAFYLHWEYESISELQVKYSLRNQSRLTCQYVTIASTSELLVTYSLCTAMTRASKMTSCHVFGPFTTCTVKLSLHVVIFFNTARLTSVIKSWDKITLINWNILKSPLY